MLMIGARYAFAYEQATHGVISDAAYKASRFSTDLIPQLGLNGYRPLGLGSRYLDTALTLHDAQPFELRIIRDLTDAIGSPDTLDRWLIFGSIREDDNPAEDPPTPQDVAPGLKRPLHHFYDPFPTVEHYVGI